jgi:hypothetical protein
VEDRIEPGWRKSSYSGNGGANCVEVKRGPGGAVAMRDSKNPAGPTLSIERIQWLGFVAEVKAGRHDLV